MMTDQLDPKIFMEEKYNEVFDNTYRFLKTKKIVNINNEIKLLETTLESLLVHAGNDWVGRGELSATKMNAQIAATETILIELKDMLKKEGIKN